MIGLILMDLAALWLPDADEYKADVAKYGSDTDGGTEHG